MKDLLKELQEKNIFVTLEKENLKVKFNGSEMPANLINKIREHKGQLLEYLTNLKKYSVNTEIVSLGQQPSYKLSSAQKRLWILGQFDDANVAYNMPGALIFEGELDINALTYAFNRVIDRHEILRTVFKEDDQGEIKQFIYSADDIEFQIGYEDIRGVEDQEKIINHITSSEALKPFNLASGFLLRANLYQLLDNRWLFTYTMHHIISDSWSMKILIDELLIFYNGFVKGETPLLPLLRIQYKDYAAWQLAQLDGAGLKEAKAYWLQQFGGELPVFSLMSKGGRPLLKTYKGETMSWNIPSDLAKAISVSSRENGATMFMYLLTVIDILLYRYTEQEDIIIGSTVSGREHSDLEEQIGFYVNVLPLRCHLNGDNTFKELLEYNKKTTLEAYEHQIFPFNELIDNLNLPRDFSRNALFDVLIEYRHKEKNSSQKESHLENLTVSEHLSNQHSVSKFDLTFFLTESDEGLNILLEYNTDIYEKELIERMLPNLENLMRAVLQSPLTPINQLDYITLDEKNTLVLEFNPITKPNYDLKKTVLSLFEEQVSVSYNQTALISNSKEITYGELNEKANQLASYLINTCDTKPNDLIGIMLDRSENIIISILAIWKCGAAFVPVDTDYPKSRKEYIIKETNIVSIITQAEYAFDLDYFQGNIFAIDIQLELLSAPIEPIVINTFIDNISYVIYTSGSTGHPKGCTIKQFNLSNYVQWANLYYFKTIKSINFGFYTSLSFDFTLTSIFCTLTQGGILTVFDHKQSLSEILRYSFSAESKINCIKLTPSHIDVLKILSIESSGMACAIIGGEAVQEGHVDVLKKLNPEMEVYNEYGPTETTIGCVVKKLENNLPVVIGKPITGVQVYILDSNRRLCPIGVEGEIYIGGDCVGIGYWNQAKLTSMSFLEDDSIGSGTIYKTGDLARWNNEGDLIYSGRKDGQVKIRGNRVETGEIEYLLRKHPAIDACVVIAKHNMDNIYELVAYLVSNQDVNGSQLRSFLNRDLQGYMLPEHFIFIDSLPLTINGKIDIRNLPDPFVAKIKLANVYVPPGNEIEIKLTSIWQEILQRESIGIKDNFFDLGGNSLKIVKMSMLISQEFGKNVSVVELFSLPNILAIAEFLTTIDIHKESNELAMDIDKSSDIMDDTLNLLQQNKYED